MIVYTFFHLGTTPVTTPSSQGDAAEDNLSVTGPGGPGSDQDFDEDVEEPSLRPSPSEFKRKQTTAIILLGVIGAEFGLSLIDLVNMKNPVNY